MATSNFPSSLDTTSALPASISETANLNSPNHADMHEVTNDAIIEIEEKLGTGETTASTGAVLIGTGSGASAWDTTPTFLGNVTVGVDGTGHDVKFYGDHAGAYMQWVDDSSRIDVYGRTDEWAIYVGEGNVYIEDTLDVDGTTNLDVVNIAGAVTVGENDTGYDVTFHGDTAGHKAHWDTSANALAISGSASMLRLVDLDSDSAPYIGFYDSSYNASEVTGRLGYVGYPNNDDLYVRNDNAGGVTFIKSASTIKLEATSGVEVDGGLETDTLSINSTAVTSTAAELNILDGCTATYTELNILDGVVATAAEVNTVADVTLGTVAANKAVTVDANKDVTGFRHLTMTGDLDVDGTTDLDAVDVDGVLTVTDGSAGAPAIAFGSDTDSGFYLYSAGNVAGSAGGSRRMQFSSSGLYAIKATNNSSSYAGWSTATGYLVAKTSSIRYKENIKDIPKEEWEKIYNLQARSFDWKESAFDDNAYDANRKDDHGFIAEEVNEHLPYAVIWDKDHESSDNEYRIQSVGYGELTPYLVEAVKDLKARIETLEG